jgi:hypothetical protein
VNRQAGGLPHRWTVAIYILVFQPGHLHPGAMHRRLVIVFFALAVGLGVMVWQARGPLEPCYQGKRLRDWLIEMNVAQNEGGEDSIRYTRAAKAIRQMGTNSLPTLLTMLGSEDSQFKKALQGLADKQSLLHFEFIEASNWRNLAEAAIYVLGPIAAPAIPQLIEMLSATNADIRGGSAGALGSIHSQEDIVVPALTNALKDPSIEVRRSAEWALWIFGKLEGKKTDLVIAVLVAQLDSKDPWEFGGVCALLGTLGPQARSAWPALMVRLSDQDYRIRFAATNALLKIDPEAAAKAGVETHSPPPPAGATNPRAPTPPRVNPRRRDRDWGNNGRRHQRENPDKAGL